jgi:hypothetical protein
MGGVNGGDEDLIISVLLVLEFKLVVFQLPLQQLILLLFLKQLFPQHQDLLNVL